MDLTKNRTAIIVATAVLWLACMFLGWKDYFVTAMCLGVVLMLLYMLLGAAKNGVVPKKLLVYPLGAWAILWIASFILSKYFSDLFAGVIPGFTIGGFHPSFAFTVFFYWIGGILTLTVGFVLRKDEWLSEKDWKDFLNRVRQEGK
ncbi:MAG: hypothetical protein LBQ90_06955 [Synergistaceae bacterium]|jgi:hypothetical protein|nr:hypothetical protein [Synergistaceae bacterium]